MTTRAEYLRAVTWPETSKEYARENEWAPNGLSCYDHPGEDPCELPCPACDEHCDPALIRPTADGAL